MSAPRNLTSIKNNIARRIRQALEELQENLGNRQRVPVPVPVPVPMRGGRGYRLPRSSRYGFSGGFMFAGIHGNFHSTRFYSTYSSRFSGFRNMRWSNINGSLMFQNFSSRGQFRLKLFTTFYKAPTITELLKKKWSLTDDQMSVWDAHKRAAQPTSTAMDHVPLALRLNILLTQKFHDLVMDLARATPQSAMGCYVDFKIMPRILIPLATMMSAEVLSELLVNLKNFEKHIVELQQDLARLSELGELPLRFLASNNIIRVYFPNCDRPQLEALLIEKDVMSGIIHEDFQNECDSLSSDDVSSVSEFDILSSCNMLSQLSLSGSESCYDDVLSSSCESAHKLDQVQIFEEDSYYWA